MAPLPPDSTARFFLDYTDGQNDHTLIARLGAGASVSVAMDEVNGFMLALAPELYLVTIIGARIASDNSNVTNPQVWTGAATYGTGAMPKVNAPRELRFLSRSTDGRRGSVSVYGFKGATPEDYRIMAGANANIANAIAALETANNVDVFLTISTSVPAWKPYASFNFNSYWEREARP